MEAPFPLASINEAGDNRPQNGPKNHARQKPNAAIAIVIRAPPGPTVVNHGLGQQHLRFGERGANFYFLAEREEISVFFHRERREAIRTEF